MQVVWQSILKIRIYEGEKMIQEQIKKLVDANDAYLRKQYEHFHQYPELSSLEFETDKKIISELEMHGISFEKIPERI